MGGGVDVRLHSFLTWALPEDDYPTSQLGRFIRGRISPLPIQYKAETKETYLVTGT